MVKSISIRTAERRDAEAVGQLAQEFAEYLRSLGDLTEFKLNAGAFLRDGFGERPAFAGIVAEEEGRVVGYLLYHFGYDSDAAERTLYIADLYVQSTARRRGVGTLLVKAAAGIAREAGAGEMIWSVYRDNDLAADFYEKLGAERITEVFFMKLRANGI